LTSLRDIGLRDVPRTAATRSASRVPSASYEHYGDHVLQADIGNIAIVHYRGDGRGEAHGQAKQLIGLEGSPGEDSRDGVERPLDRRAYAPLLDVRLSDGVVLAQLLDQTTRLGFLV
jgi:hypothetical protein